MHPKRVENPAAVRPKLTTKEMDGLVSAAWSQGAWCVRAGNQHVKIYPPNDGQMVTIPSTPSSPRRTYRNKRAALRKVGIRIP